MYIILLYIFIFIILFYIFIALYFTCKMPFWSKQPVFHWYNILYWLNGPPGLVSKELPQINKYVDLCNIKTFSLNENYLEVENADNKEEFSSICEFIKINYIYTNDAVDTNAVDTNAVDTNAVGTVYAPTKDNILDYLLHSNHPSYFTIYREAKICVLPDSKDIIAVISARPLYVRLKKTALLSTTKTMFTTYYVDNLCVQAAYRKKSIAATMIQTHYYNLRHKNKLINNCLFKREGKLNSIVPLVTFNTYCLSLEGLVNNLSAPQHSIIEVSITHIHLFIDFLKNNMKYFNCIILPDITNLSHLIKSGNLRIYCLVINNSINNIIACYVFRLLELTYDEEKTSECIATINTGPIDLFQYGFHQACSLLKQQANIALILIEETAHTDKLMTPTLKQLVKFTSPTAFFFYNYACYTIKKQKCLIIY